MNKKNHNLLDAAINAERKNVSLAIASHERSEKTIKACIVYSDKTFLNLAGLNIL